MNKLVKTVSKTDLYKEFLKSLNGILDLTDRELELLATFIDIDINTPKLPNIKGRVEDEVMVSKALVPEIIGDRVQVTIVLRISKDESGSNDD